MSKKGRDEEIERLTAEFLKKYDKTPPRKRMYKTDRQMERKSKKEMPISNLSKKKVSEMENKLFSFNKGEDDQC